MTSTTNDFYAILSAPNKLIDEAENELAHMLRHVCFVRGITRSNFDPLFMIWLNKETIRGQGRSQRSSIAGNTLKALAGKSITWNTWLRFLQIVSPSAGKFSVLLHWGDGVVTSHERFFGNDPNLNTVSRIQQDLDYIKSYDPPDEDYVELL